LDPNYPDEIINSWVESFEESYGIYRPVDFKIFPQLIYRQYYNLMEDNKCEYLVLSPVDAHYLENGFWEYIAKEKVLKIYNQDKELQRELKVGSISKDLLD
jgi:hypothetical protein